MTPIPSGRGETNGTFAKLVGGWEAPATIGLASFILVWWMWGSLTNPPINHDEAAYVLQARIFASGHLVAPGRPIPEFFEQFHTFVQPVVAAKYPPGFSLILVPGVWLHLVGIVPALLAGTSSALLFVLARRFSGLGVALLAVILANTSDIALNFNPSYSSETATAFLFIAGWWSLVGYHESGKRRWLYLLALAVGWGAITRPLTMLAYAVPTGLAAMVSISRRRDWRVIPYCLAIVGTVLAFMGMWDAVVTGSWRKAPHAEYARLYIPSDRMGFGVQGGPPARQLSGEQEAFREWVDSLHRGHTPENLPSIAGARLRGLMVETWSRDIVGAFLALFGFLCVPVGVARVAWATIILVFASHLFYAHALDWPAYYLELQGPLVFMSAAALVAAGKGLAESIGRARDHASHPLIKSVLPNALSKPILVSFLFAFWLLAPVPPDVLYHRRASRVGRTYVEHFRSVLDTLPKQPSIVFVRYAPDHSPHQSLVQNEPDSAARLWIVHDLGPEDLRLLSLAPDRRAYLYSETKSLNRITGKMSSLATSNAP